MKLLPTFFMIVRLLSKYTPQLTEIYLILYMNKHQTKKLDGLAVILWKLRTFFYVFFSFLSNILSGEQNWENLFRQLTLSWVRQFIF